jgi:hypothetical protein
MADCRWRKPELAGQFEFLEWSAGNYMRHKRYYRSTAACG